MQPYPLPAAFPLGDIRRTRDFLVEDDAPARQDDTAFPCSLFVSTGRARNIVLLVAGSSPHGLVHTPAIRQMADLWESDILVEFLVPTAEMAEFYAAVSTQGSVAQLIPVLPEDQLLYRIDKLGSDQLLVIIPQGCSLGAGMADAVRRVQAGEADSLIGVPSKILLGDGIRLAVEEKPSGSAPAAEVASIHSRSSAVGHITRRRTFHEEAPIVDHGVTGRAVASMIERVTDATAFQAFPFSGLAVINGYGFSERDIGTVKLFAERLAEMGHEIVLVCPESEIRNEEVAASLSGFNIITTTKNIGAFDPPVFSFLASSGHQKPTIVFDWDLLEPELTRLQSVDLDRILAFASFMTQAESKCTLTFGAPIRDGDREFQFLCLRHDRQIGAGDFTRMDERGRVLDRL